MPNSKAFKERKWFDDVYISQLVVAVFLSYKVIQSREEV